MHTARLEERTDLLRELIRRRTLILADLTPVRTTL
jgi:hypothetical protein